MQILLSTIIQLAITSRVIAMSFESILKTLPTDIPADFRNIMLELYSKHPKDFTKPDFNNVTINSVKMMTHLDKKQSVTSRTTVSMTKSVTRHIKPATQTRKPVTRTHKPVTTTRKIARTGSTTSPSKPGTPLPNKVTTTEIPAKTTKWSPQPPLFGQIPSPAMAIPVPMPVPVYPRVPVMIPMRTYFEPVVHDHPPLYKIREMIEADEKKWGKDEKGKGCEISVEINEGIFDTSKESSSDSSSDSSSAYNDVGSEYYDDFIRITRGRDR